MSCFLITGWYDHMRFGIFESYKKITKDIGPERLRKKVKLLIGPWIHSGVLESLIGEIDTGGASSGKGIDITGMHIRWFDYWLKGIDNGIMDEAPVRIFVMGDNVWRDEYEWPLARTNYTPYYFHSNGQANTSLNDGTLSTRPPGDQEADIYIINHDYLSKLKYPLAAKNFDFIIVDELTKFKHHNTQRSKALRFITKDIRYRLGLTGSPITQSPMDAFGEMLVIDPTLYGDNFFAFRNHYFYNATARAPFPTWVPVKNRLVKLANKLAEVCLRLEKKDCLDLPPMVVETREIEMPSKMSSDYDQMVKHLVLELKEYGVATAEVVLKKLIRLAQITSGFVKSEEGEEVDLGYSPKINELKDLVENELAGKKVIVWARFVRTIEQLAEQFKDLKPAVVWGGDINMEHRHEEIRRFQQDPDCKMFIGQISLGFGFNLTAADTMVYVEHNFSVEDRHQTKGRFDRIGQTAEKTTVIDLVMKNSIDTYMLRSVKENQSVADFIYDVLRMKRKEE